MTTKTKSQEDIPIKNGFVAFIDILGYQRLVEHNEIKDVVLLLKKVVKNVRMWHKAHTYALKPNNPPNILIFSDSMLIDLPLAGSASETEKSVFACSFICLCQQVMDTMFWLGLPCKGAVAYGDYFIQRQNVMLAGKPIIEAHNLSYKVDFAGCALQDQVLVMIRKSREQFIKSLLLRWEALDKNNNKTELHMVRYLLNVPSSEAEVLARFAAHKKPTGGNGENVQRKIERTWEFIQMHNQNSQSAKRI